MSKRMALAVFAAAALASGAALGAEYVWTGAGAAGVWDDADNWTGGSAWPGSAGGDTATIGTDLTISSNFSIAAGTLAISNTVNTTLNFNCSISGEGAIYKGGAGHLELRQNNSFSGGFTSEGTGTTGQCYVHLYAAEGLGQGTATIKSSRGDRLDIHGPLTVPTDIRFGADLSNTGSLKLYGSVTFTGKIYPNSRWQFYTAGDGGTHTFNAVNTGNGNFFPRVGANDTVIFSQPIKFSSGADIYTTLSSGSSNGGRVRLNASGNEWWYFHVNSDSFVCGADDALPKKYYLFAFENANAKIDLNGHDQTITLLSTQTRVVPWCETASAGVTAFGFTNSSSTAASLVFSGLASGAQHIGFRGRLYGKTGLTWAPTSADATFTFSNTVQTATGALVVSNGTVCVTNGAGFKSLALVELAAAGKLSIASGLSVVTSAARIGDVDLPSGEYTSGDCAANLPGEGRLVVLGYSEEDSNIWKGGNGSWSEPTNWSRGSVPAAGDKVVLNGSGVKVTLSSSTAALGTLLLFNGAKMEVSGEAACISSGSIGMYDGATITCAGPFTNDLQKTRVWISCGDIVIGSGAAIDLNGKGYASGDYAASTARNGYGPGGGISCTGASHGGLGGHQSDKSSAHAKDVYDDPEHPAIAGSGGYKKYANTGCHGGGVLRLEATGSVTVNGEIRANGGSSSSAGTASLNNDTAASGGAIWITCRTIGGSGTITARGGDGDHAPYPAWFYGMEGYCPPGGGGMVAIHYDSSAQTVSAASGLSVSASCGRFTGTRRPVTLATQDDYFTQAELGSVWFTDAKLVEATLGRGLSGRIVHPVGYASPVGLEFTNGHVRFEGAGVAVSFGGDVAVSGPEARLEVGGVCYTNRSSRSEVYAGTSPVSFSVAGDFTVTGGGRFDIRSAATNGVARFGATVTVAGDMTVGAGSRVVPWSDVKNTGSPTFSVGGDFTVASGGSVFATGRGGAGAAYSGLHSPYPYAGNRGSGLGGGQNRSAASYGGRGGLGVSTREGSGTSSPNAYGSWCYPNDCGSGGGAASHGSGGAGGGLVRIFAAGAITVDGEIAADGLFPPYYYLRRLNNYNSGSGGAVYLSGATFSGTGSIHVNGGESHHGWVTESSVEYEAECGSGGGGRIAIWTGAPPDESRANAGGSRTAKSQSPIETDGRVFTGTVTASAGEGCFDYNVADENKRPTLGNTLGEDGTVWFFHRLSPAGSIMLLR